MTQSSSSVFLLVTYLLIWIVMCFSHVKSFYLFFVIKWIHFLLYLVLRHILTAVPAPKLQNNSAILSKRSPCQTSSFIFYFVTKAVIRWEVILVCEVRKESNFNFFSSGFPFILILLKSSPLAQSLVGESYSSGWPYPMTMWAAQIRASAIKR